MARIRFHPEAWNDYFDAVDWYKSKSAQIAQEFEETIDRELAEILEHPERWPLLDKVHRSNLLDRFPVQVIYQIVDDDVLVIAVAHSSRRPRYWRKRRVE